MTVRKDEGLTRHQRWMGERHRPLTILTVVLLTAFVLGMVLETIDRGTVARTLPVGVLGVVVFLALLFQLRRLGRRVDGR